MEKETLNGKISIKNKAFGKGTFTGDYTKGTFGDYPHGYGKAQYPNSQIVQEGYFKKGEFIKGKMETPLATFSGIFEKDYLIEGRAELPNGDFGAIEVKINSPENIEEGIKSLSRFEEKIIRYINNAMHRCVLNKKRSRVRSLFHTGKIAILLG